MSKIVSLLPYSEIYYNRNIEIVYTHYFYIICNYLFNTMKKIIIFVLFTAFISPLSFAQAQSQTPTSSETVQSAPTRQNILRERIEQQRTNYRQNLQEAREIAQQYRAAENEADRDALRSQTRNGFLVRLTNAVDRLVTIQDRIENRITTAETSGVDVSEAKSHLNLSREATQAILDNQETLRTILENNQDPKNEEVRTQAQTIFETIKENFKKARMSLVDAAQALRKALNTPEISSENETPEEETGSESENEPVEETEN